MLAVTAVFAPFARGALLSIATPASVAATTVLSAAGVVLNEPGRQEQASITPVEPKLANVTSVTEVVQRAPLPRRVGPLELEVVYLAAEARSAGTWTRPPAPRSGSGWSLATPGAKGWRRSRSRLACGRRRTRDTARTAGDLGEAGMAQPVTIALEDDLDGGPAEDTLRSGSGGAGYEIGLSATNTAAFGQQVCPVLEHARTAGRGQARGPASTAGLPIGMPCAGWVSGEGGVLGTGASRWHLR
jgi:Lsr2